MNRFTIAVRAHVATVAPLLAPIAVWLLAGLLPAAAQMPVDLSGKHIGVSVTTECARAQSYYCDDRHAEMLSTIILAEFSARHAAVVTTGEPDVTAYVTINALGQHAPDPSAAECGAACANGGRASYTLADAVGRVLLTGHVEDPDARNVGAVLVNIAEQIATALYGAPAAPVVLPPAAPEIPKQRRSFQQLESAAGQAGFYDILADAYRTLTPKPALPTDARAQQHAAEELAKDQKYDDAADAYQAGLKLVPWWAEGYRDLALVLEKLNRISEAGANMQLYLKFAPDAPDAASMQQKLQEWARMDPPPVAPSHLAMPAGASGIGVMLADTPDILAAAANIPDLKGALVTFVLTGSPAEKATLSKGDIVTAYNDKPIVDAAGLQLAIRTATEGEKFKLGVVRGTQKLTLEVPY